MQNSSSKLDLELARFVLQQGEKRLDAQLQIAIAADQRAMILAGIFVAIATLISGAGIHFLSKNELNLPLGIGFLTTAICLIISSVQCIRAVMPGRYGLAGAQPKNWWEDNVEDRPLAECLRKESDNYQKRIAFNSEVHKRNAAILKRGAILGCLSQLIGLLTAVAVLVAA